MQFDKESPPDLSNLGSSHFSINFPPFAILVISHPDEAATLPKASKGTISPPTHSFFFAIFIQIRGFTPFTYGIVSSDVSEGQKSHTTLMLKCHPLFSVMTFSWNISSFNLWSQSGGVACQRQNHPQAIYSAKLHHNQLAGKKEARMAKHRWRRNCVTSTLNSTLLVWRALLARLEHAPCSLLSFIQKRIFVPSLIWESRKGIRTLKRKVFLISWFQQLNSIPL